MLYRKLILLTKNSFRGVRIVRNGWKIAFEKTELHWKVFKNSLNFMRSRILLTDPWRYPGNQRHVKTLYIYCVIFFKYRTLQKRRYRNIFPPSQQKIISFDRCTNVQAAVRGTPKYSVNILSVYCRFLLYSTENKIVEIESSFLISTIFKFEWRAI